MSRIWIWLLVFVGFFGSGASAANSTVAGLPAASALTRSDLFYCVKGGANAKYTANESQLFSEVVTPLAYGAVGNGTADDTTAFQNAVNSGKPVYVPAGYNFLIRRITPPSNTHIYGPGTVTSYSNKIGGVFYLAGATRNYNNFTIDGVNYVGYENVPLVYAFASSPTPGTLMTSASTAPGGLRSVSNTLTFALVPSWVVPGMAIYDATTPAALNPATNPIPIVVSTTNTTVTMSTPVRGTVNSGDTIRFSYIINGVTVKNTTTANGHVFWATNNGSSAAGLFGYGSTANVVVKNNVAVGAANQPGLSYGATGAIQLYYVSYFDVDGNTIRNYGHGVTWWGGDSDPSRAGNVGLPRGTAHGTITNNTVTNTGYGGIWGSLGDDITVSGNSVTSSGDTAIDNEGGTNIVFANNRVRYSSVSPGGGGISSFFYVTNFTVVGNIVHTTNGALPFAIHNSYGSGNPGPITVTGNQFISMDSNVATMTIEAVDNLHFSNNYFSNIAFSIFSNGFHNISLVENYWTYADAPTSVPAFQGWHAGEAPFLEDYGHAGSLLTSSSAAAGSSTLTFASVPSWIVPGMFISDYSNINALSPAPAVMSATGTTVTMSAHVGDTYTVKSGDTIKFSFLPAAIYIARITPGGLVTIRGNTILGPSGGTSAAEGIIVCLDSYDGPSSQADINDNHINGFAISVEAACGSSNPGVSEYWSIANNYMSGDYKGNAWNRATGLGSAGQHFVRLTNNLDWNGGGWRPAGFNASTWTAGTATTPLAYFSPGSTILTQSPSGTPFKYVNTTAGTPGTWAGQ
jgi:parallel beta-helix repeat protein